MLGCRCMRARARRVSLRHRRPRGSAADAMELDFELRSMPPVLVRLTQTTNFSLLLSDVCVCVPVVVVVCVACPCFPHSIILFSKASIRYIFRWILCSRREGPEFPGRGSSVCLLLIQNHHQVLNFPERAVKVTRIWFRVVFRSTAVCSTCLLRSL